jgi:hypothetical protein
MLPVVALAACNYFLRIPAHLSHKATSAPNGSEFNFRASDHNLLWLTVHLAVAG